MNRIALVRHPALRGTAGLCYGRSDFPLADPQADIPPILDRLALWQSAVVHTSPSLRCRVVAEQLGGSLRVDPRLRELDFGAWEERPWNEVPRASLDLWVSDPAGFVPPGGESGAQLVERVRQFSEEALSEGGDQIVVSHGGPLKVLMALLRGEAVNLLAATLRPGAVTILSRCYQGPCCGFFVASSGQV